MGSIEIYFNFDRLYPKLDRKTLKYLIRCLDSMKMTAEDYLYDLENHGREYEEIKEAQIKLKQMERTPENAAEYDELENKAKDPDMIYYFISNLESTLIYKGNMINKELESIGRKKAFDIRETIKDTDCSAVAKRCIFLIRYVGTMYCRFHSNDYYFKLNDDYFEAIKEE